MRDRPSLQATVATAAAELDAARLLLRESLSTVWAAARAGHDSTLTERARTVGAIMLAARSAKNAAASVVDAGGTSALYTDCPIERANRDIQALTQHIVLNPRSWEDAGRVYLGLMPGGGF
jgi:alkylation response protein AidB-like acyl-CoA dehydrogenase